MHHFNKLNLPSMLEKALVEMNLEIPTSIQAKAIPVALAHRDLIGCSPTGTGKTVAFCLPLIARLIKVPQKTALILVPTRELGIEILEVLKKLTHHCPEIKSALVIGGMAMPPQIRALQGRSRVLVATPGRLVDHLKRGTVSLSSTEVLVLDEADRMLDMGFAPQLNEILRFLPKTRQTLFFSATLPADIEKLSTRFLKDPVRIITSSNATPRWTYPSPEKFSSLGILG